MSIVVDSLSKCYLIRHQHNAAYKTLRESVMSYLNPKKYLNRNSINSSEHFWALKDLSFSIETGDRVGVIGRNGAGKSTLLKILSRITPPTKGKIHIKGKVASLLEVGTGFHPELTGRENIFLNGALLGMSKAEIRKKFDEIVTFAEVERFLDTPVKRYSSGMYVRLAFAVAAHLEPDILFIDEALAVGDVKFQKKCIGKMEQVAQQGRTILFVTHSMGSLGFCNKGILLDKGCLIATSSIQECIQKYHDEIVLSSESNWTGEIGNEQIKIFQLSIESQKSLGVFTRGSQGKAKAIIEVQKPATDLVVGFRILNKNGALLIESKAHQNDQIPLIMPVGRYCFEVDVDFSLFSEGLFRLELDVGIHNVKKISTPDINVSFEVINEHKRYAEPANIIYPNWNWSIKNINS